MHHAFVGVHHLLQVYGTVAVVCKGSIGIEVLVCLHDGVDVCICFHHHGGKDASGKVATIGDEVDRGFTACCSHLRHLLQGVERLAYLCQMLVFKGFVDAHIAIAPREVGGGGGLLPCSRASCDGVYRHIVLQQLHLGGRQQCQLYAGGKATGVGYMLCRAYLLPVQLGQSIHKVVVGRCHGQCCIIGFWRSYAVVLCQVDDAHMRWYGMSCQELLALAMTEAEEHHIHLIERHL